jgi:hypothetical protein
MAILALSGRMGLPLLNTFPVTELRCTAHKCNLYLWSLNRNVTLLTLLNNKLEDFLLTSGKNGKKMGKEERVIFASRGGLSQGVGGGVRSRS